MNAPEQVQQLHNQVATAATFFGQVFPEIHPNYYPGVAAAPAAPPPPVDQNTSGLFSAVQLSKDAPASVQNDMETAARCMLNLTSLGTTYCQSRAAKANNPDLLFDTSVWKPVLVNYPLLGPFDFQMSGFKKTVRGVDISSEFLQSILGFVAKGPVLGAFQTFIGSFGQKISAGVDSSSKPFHFASNAVFIDVQQVGNNWMVMPHLKMYFCDFTSKDRKIYSSCASATMVDIDLEYIAVDTIWNFELYKSNPSVKAGFDKLVGASALNKIEEATTFFSDTVS
jgi:hypothetical protein